MARVLITGSTTGLGALAARQLLDDGHDVVLHARSPKRAADVADLARRAAGVVIGEFASLEDTRHVAEQADAIGGIDAVIHNAGIYVDPQLARTVDGHVGALAVNVLAPYLLTAGLGGSSRHIYLSSDMHAQGNPSLADIDWTTRRWNGTQAYCDSKLYVTALAFAVPRRLPNIHAHAVDPGWVPTRMGGPGAPDDLELGHRTQTWLAVTNEPAATGEPRYWYHQQPQPPPPAPSTRTSRTNCSTCSNTSPAPRFPRPHAPSTPASTPEGPRPPGARARACHRAQQAAR